MLLKVILLLIGFSALLGYLATKQRFLEFVDTAGLWLAGLIVAGALYAHNTGAIGLAFIIFVCTLAAKQELEKRPIQIKKNDKK